MNIIRVTKTARNRVDVIFTGYQYLFFHADFGLVAIAESEDNTQSRTQRITSTSCVRSRLVRI